jgi:hypothetical protein
MNFTVTAVERKTGLRTLMGRTERYSELSETVHGVRTRVQAEAEFDMYVKLMSLRPADFASVKVTNRIGEIVRSAS